MPRKPWIPARKRRTQVYRKPNETKHFTHYWKNSTWTDGSESEGEPLDHTASNLFGKRGVTKGDLVYVLTVKRGLLYLCARLEVDRVTSQEDAEQQFGEEVWPAKDHIIASPKSGTLQRYGQHLPPATARELRFVTSGGTVGPVLTPGGLLHRQTMRGVRELTPTSAALLDRYLAD